MALPTKNVLRVVEIGYICRGENTVFKDFDAVQKSIVTLKNILTWKERVFADSVFSSATCSPISFIVGQRAGSS